MQILLLTPALPYPPHQGGALRNFGILSGLHAAGHAVSLLSFADAASETGNTAGTPLPELCAQVETVTAPARTPRQRLRDLLLTRQPDLARRLESAEFREKLRQLLSKTRFELIQFEGLEMAIYLALARHMQPTARLVYDAHNAEFALQGAIASVEREKRARLPAMLYSSIQAQRITRFEQQVCAESDAVIAVSQEDANALRPFRPDRQIHVVANGIFTADYAEPPQQSIELAGAALVFTGKMDYRPNVDAVQWFASDILPLIRERCPEARLYVVGQKPHASLQTLSVDDSVEVTGWVEKVQPFLHAAQVYVAPLRMGSGTRLKILEAMAAGCAVVATSAAVAGLDAETRQALVIADSETAFADATVRLLETPEIRRTLGQKAQLAVRRHYDWSALMPSLLEIYRGIGLG